MGDSNNILKPRSHRGTRSSYCHPRVNPLKSELLRANCNPGSLLDVGCGNGLYPLDCQDQCFDIVQIDLEDRRDPKAQKFQFYAMNADDLSMLSGPFDNIIAFDIMEHLDDDISFLRSAHRLLRDGGKLFVSVPNEDNSLLEKINLAHIHFTDKTHRREYSCEGLKNLFKAHNFTVLQISPHINKSVVNFPNAIQRNNILSKCVSRFISFQIRGCERLGLFQNKIVSDWFGVFEK